MDRINKIGRALISYKSEFSKHYSPIVDESLMIALETQLEKKLLDQDIFDKIINDSYPLAEFEKFISNKREYAKSQKELLEEFEKVRAIVNESLINANFTEYIETESNIEINKISVLRQYTMSEEFIKLYFGLEDEDIPQIMKKKGFAEKFAVLRLTKVFKEIYAEMRQETDFQQGFSRVYYNPDVNGFSVDYKYHLPVDFINNSNVDEKIKKIKDTDKVVERKFTKKTGINFYNIKTNQNVTENLNVPKNSPNNKFSEIKVTEDEVKKIQTEVNETEESKKENTVQEKSTSAQKNNNEKQEPKKENKKENKPVEQKNENKQNQKTEHKENQLSKENQKDKNKKTDYLNDNLNDSREVISIIEEVSNMKVEEDMSGDFSIDNFEGFIEDVDLDIPNDIDIPDDIDMLDDIDMNFDDVDDDI